jgi:nitrogen fixation protein FixH
VNLAFHEMGHAALTWFGNRMLTVAGGTIFQIGIPIAAGAYLLHKQRDPFGASVDNHDWTVMLMRYGMLTRDAAIGAALRRSGIFAMLASLVAGAWVISVMAASRHAPPAESS